MEEPQTPGPGLMTTPADDAQAAAEAEPGRDLHDAAQSPAPPSPSLSSSSAVWVSSDEEEGLGELGDAEESDAPGLETEVDEHAADARQASRTATRSPSPTFSDYSIL